MRKSIQAHTLYSVTERERSGPPRQPSRQSSGQSSAQSNQRLNSDNRSQNASSSNQRISNSRTRRKQYQFIEVRTRSQKSKRKTVRRAFFWGTFVILLSGLGYGSYLAATKGLSRFFFNNPDYDITSIDIQTDGTLSRDKILETANIHEKTNIFHVNLDEARSILETLPEVQNVQLERQLPGKISIQVTERKPVAWIAPAKRGLTLQQIFDSPDSFLIDSEGYLIRPKKILAQNYLLPIIRGASSERYTPGQKIDTEEMKATLSLLKTNQDSLVGARFQISSIDLSRGYGLMVTDAHSQLQVLFGLDDPEIQLKTLDTLLQAIDQSGRKPATISLMTMSARQRNIPVTFKNDSRNDGGLPTSFPSEESFSKTGTNNLFNGANPSNTPSNNPSNDSRIKIAKAVPVNLSKNKNHSLPSKHSSVSTTSTSSGASKRGNSKYIQPFTTN